MSPDDQFLSLALLSLFAVAAVVILLALVMAPVQLRSVPPAAPRWRRYATAFGRAVRLSAVLIGALILLLQIALVAMAIAGSRKLSNQVPGLEAAMLQLALCSALYWVASGAAHSGAVNSFDDETN